MTLRRGSGRGAALVLVVMLLSGCAGSADGSAEQASGARAPAGGVTSGSSLPPDTPTSDSDEPSASALPSGASPSATAPYVVEPSGPEPSGPEPSGPEPSGPEPSGPEPAGSTPPGPAPAASTQPSLSPPHPGPGGAGGQPPELGRGVRQLVGRVEVDQATGTRVLATHSGRYALIGQPAELLRAGQLVELISRPAPGTRAGLPVVEVFSAQPVR